MRKDDPSNDPNYGAEKGNYDTPVDAKVEDTNTENTENTENPEQGTSAGDFNVDKIVTKPTPTETEENKIKTTDGSSLGDGLDGAENADERKKLMDQSKKEMYANAWQNSGIGHIVEAGKSIGRGIKNIKAKRKAKKAIKAKRNKTGEKLKNSVKKSKKANLKKGIVGPTIGGVGQTKFKDLSNLKIK